MLSLNFGFEGKSHKVVKFDIVWTTMTCHSVHFIGLLRPTNLIKKNENDTLAKVGVKIPHGCWARSSNLMAATIWAGSKY